MKEKDTRPDKPERLEPITGDYTLDIIVERVNILTDRLQKVEHALEQEARRQIGISRGLIKGRQHPTNKKLPKYK